MIKCSQTYLYRLFWSNLSCNTPYLTSKLVYTIGTAPGIACGDKLQVTVYYEIANGVIFLPLIPCIMIRRIIPRELFSQSNSRFHYVSIWKLAFVSGFKIVTTIISCL